MILVTGAAGKTGRAITKALDNRAFAVRALVRRREQAVLSEESGAREVVVGDMTDPATMLRAVQGAHALYHICPNMNRQEAFIGDLLIEAARGAGVSHFVLHSVLHPQVKEMPHHWSKMRVEAKLFQSGLPFTVLQPAAYMQNLLPQWESIVAKGIYRTPYPVDTELALVDLHDVAEVAAVVLTEPGHEHGIYELAGPENLTQTQVAAVLATMLGRPVQAEELPLSAWRRQARLSGQEENQIDMLEEMFQYYAAFGFRGNPWILERLLSRSATDLASFASRVEGERRSSSR